MSKIAAAIASGDKQEPGQDLTGKGQAIVDAAVRIFLEQGYGAASMDAIAAEAGVSKQTVYSHFGAKEALFEAIIQGKCRELMPPDSLKWSAGQDHEKTLRLFAQGFLMTVLAAPNTALFRVVIAESVRFPELAEAFYRAGPAAACDYLAGYLGKFHQAGALSVPEPKESARQFFALLRGDLYFRRLLNLTPPPKSAEVEAVVGKAVSAFLAAHAPD